MVGNFIELRKEICRGYFKVILIGCLLKLCLQFLLKPLKGSFNVCWASLVAQTGKNPPAMQETWV